MGPNLVPAVNISIFTKTGSKTGGTIGFDSQPNFLVCARSRCTSLIYFDVGVATFIRIGEAAWEMHSLLALGDAKCTRKPRLVRISFT